MPDRQHTRDAGLDIFAPNNDGGIYMVEPHSTLHVDTGVYVELPANTVGFIKARSSMFSTVLAVRSRDVNLLLLTSSSVRAVLLLRSIEDSKLSLHLRRVRSGQAVRSIFLIWLSENITVFRLGVPERSRDESWLDVTFKMVRELLLQLSVGVTRLGSHHQSAGAHIETVGQQRTGIALTEDGGYRVAANASGNTEQPRRLADNNQCVVFIDDGDVELWRRGYFLWVRVNIKSL